MIFISLARNNGVFLGIILIVFSLVLSYVNPAVFLQSRSFILIVPFFIVLMKNAFDLRRANGGLMGFKDLFIQGMVCSVIAIFICTCFEYILFNFLYPDLKEIFRAISIEALEESGTLLGDSYTETVRDNLEKEELYNLSQSFTLFITRLLAPGVLLSSLAALMFKKTKIISNQ